MNNDLITLTSSDHLFSDPTMTKTRKEWIDESMEEIEFLQKIIDGLINKNVKGPSVFDGIKQCRDEIKKHEDLIFKVKEIQKDE